MSYSFCPKCENLLLIRLGESASELFCQNCDYTFVVSKPISSKTFFKSQKQVEDVTGGPEAWKNVDSTDAPCPKCEHPRAYFMMIQIRSADEPMTVFHKCCNHECGHQWREN